MITGATKNKVDDVWQKMWESGITNPIEVISQLTYLMFMRSLDEKEFEIERIEMLTEEPQSHIFPQTPEGQQMRWNRFKDLEPEAILHLHGKRHVWHSEPANAAKSRQRHRQPHARFR